VSARTAERVARTIYTETNTVPPVPLVIEVLDGPRVRRPVTVVLPRAEPTTEEIPRVAGSDLPARGVDDTFGRELEEHLRERARKALRRATGEVDAIDAPDAAEALGLLEAYVGPRRREPTVTERRAHVGSHRSAERRALLDSMTAAAFIALLVTASPVAGALVWFLLGS